MSILTDWIIPVTLYCIGYGVMQSEGVSIGKQWLIAGLFIIGSMVVASS